MKKHIKVLEPEKFELCLNGYNEGYEVAKYDLLESFYLRIKEGGDQELLKIKDEIINQFEHGGIKCA